MSDFRGVAVISVLYDFNLNRRSIKCATTLARSCTKYTLLEDYLLRDVTESTRISL